ncbi:MAG: type II toxin-antitoxin system RelE/ParE family toxin [Schwartzia sp.]|nr:type II toxin-antitoxin system RelE/ParE family toxin [Schwartzia sp. (in: firmicutes)]
MHLSAKQVLDSQVLISYYFVKKTQKTPPAEIEKAKRLLQEFRERSGNNGGKLC